MAATAGGSGAADPLAETVDGELGLSDADTGRLAVHLGRLDLVTGSHLILDARPQGIRPHVVAAELWNGCALSAVASMEGVPDGQLLGVLEGSVAEEVDSQAKSDEIGRAHV